MSKGFVPFNALGPGGAPVGTGSRAKAAGGVKSGESFHSLSESGLLTRVTPPTAHEPKVTLEREGNRVTRIKVQCVCGNIIELDCE
jgi:hypothetical protein